MDVDVDIIFTENSTIGQKIRLSDQLVKALVKMKSPHPLQPHQIQGLDYDHIFPIIQWLVRKVIEHRRLTGDLVRAQSLSNFAKSYALPEEHRSEQSVKLVQTLADTYAKPQRKFRKKAGAGFDTPQSRTEATLLEYGEQLQQLAASAALGEDEEKSAQAAERAAKSGGGTRNAMIGKFEKAQSGGATGSGSANASAEKDAAARAEAEKKEQARLQGLQEQLSEVGGTAGKVSGANVGNLVGLQAEEIKRAAEAYEEMMRRQEEAMEAAVGAAGGGAGGARSQEQAFQRQLEALKRKIAAQTEILGGKSNAVAEVESKQAELAARLAKAEKRVGKIVTETGKLEALESNAANKEILSSLRSLVALNENLKAQEQSFKESCVAQRREYKELLAKLDPAADADGSTPEDEETARMRAVEKMHASELENLNKIRRVLARKNQEIATLNRRIDEVPTRAELLQYERRFVELYELSSEKHIETKKFFEMYNALQASAEFMSTEVKLLNSIIEGFPSAVSKGNAASRQEFLAKFEKILEGVAANKAHVSSEAAAVSARKDLLVEKYNALLEKQRHYFKIVKEFQEACYANETMQARIEQMEAAANTQGGGGGGGGQDDED